MIDRIRDILKNRDLKASRIKVVVAWGLDLNEMREIRLAIYALESKLKDYIGDVELQYGSRIELYPSDKTMIIIACSRKDLENIKVKSSHVSDSLIMQLILHVVSLNNYMMPKLVLSRFVNLMYTRSRTNCSQFFHFMPLWMANYCAT